MSNKNYKTARNTELKFWNIMPNQLSTAYDKSEMLKKIQALHEHRPKATIWINLINWLQLGKTLTYKQQSAIDIAYHELQKRVSINIV